MPTHKPVGELPFVDEHAIEIPTQRPLVWRALEDNAANLVRLGFRKPLAAVLGTEPRSGFAVAERDPEQRLTLVGRHRFSQYQLTFALTDIGGGVTRLSARTSAAFPGLHGLIYRVLVINSHGHALETRRMLRSVRMRSLELPPAES